MLIAKGFINKYVSLKNTIKIYMLFNWLLMNTVVMEMWQNFMTSVLVFDHWLFTLQMKKKHILKFRDI